MQTYYRLPGRLAHPPAKTSPAASCQRGSGLHPTNSFGGIRLSCPTENLKKYLQRSHPGRKRPYKIGHPADVESTQSMYPSITPHHGKTEPRRYKMRRVGIALTVLVVCWGASNVAAERITILDRCDPATFNAGGPILCDPHFDGGVTLEEFRELLTPAAFGHPAWRFNAPYLDSIGFCIFCD